MDLFLGWTVHRSVRTPIPAVGFTVDLLELQATVRATFSYVFLDKCDATISHEVCERFGISKAAGVKVGQEHSQPAHMPFRPLREKLAEKCRLYAVLSFEKRLEMQNIWSNRS